MSWAALFERAEAYEVDEAAVQEELADRRRRAGQADDGPEDDPP